MRSSSDQLIHQLSQTCDAKYIFWYADISCSHAFLSYSIHNCDNKGGSTGSFSSFVGNIKALKGALSTGSPLLLLAVSWTTKNEARNFQMYP